MRILVVSEINSNNDQLERGKTFTVVTVEVHKHNTHIFKGIQNWYLKFDLRGKKNVIISIIDLTSTLQSYCCTVGAKHNSGTITI